MAFIVYLRMPYQSVSVAIVSSAEIESGRCAPMEVNSLGSNE